MTYPNNPPHLAAPSPRVRNRRRQKQRPMIDHTVVSPCIGVCWLNEDNGWCEGCLRSADEIRDWLIMSRDQKLELLQQLAERRSSLQQDSNN